VKNNAIVSFLLVFCMLVSVLICPTVSAGTQQAQAKMYIAFRNDDIKPGMSLAVLDALNQVHINENVPVTLGIVPHPRESEEGNQMLKDDRFLTYMRSIASNPLFEFAQHGYSHADRIQSGPPSEFRGRSYDDQYNHILKGQTDIKEALGVSPTTFIPPWNNGDNTTIDVVAALGFTEYSKGYPLSLIQEGSTRVEGSLDIGGVNDTAFNASILNAQIITEQFLADPQNDNTLTITYHPAAFTNGNGAVDDHRIQQLTDFIGFLKAKGVLFTRLDRSVGFSGVSSPSPNTWLGSLNSGESNSSALTRGGGNSSAFLLIGSVGITLFGIFISVRRQDGENHKPKD
jgi:peptidoglycan/xylan/chitin deacetylase (PgdA/CDA1 family)